MSNTYSVSSVSSLASDFICPIGNRVAKFKTADKKQYCFVLPEVTDNFVQSFICNAEGLKAIQDYIESLQDKAARKVYIASGRSVCDADLTIDNLAAIALAGSENVRLTKELISKEFDGSWVNTIAYAIVLERDAANAALLLAEPDDSNLNCEVAERKEAFWKSETGQKFMVIARNYKQFFLYGSEKKPSFASQAIKDKVLQAVSYLDQDEQAVQKLSAKLLDAPIAAVDDIAL